MRRLVRILVAAGMAAAVTLMAAAAWNQWGPRHVPEGQPPLGNVEAGGVESLRKAFNDAAGSTRVLVLASPT